jgi:putative transposase
MLHVQDDILEISNSPFLNPLTEVYKEGKKVRICVDARKVNQYTVPDRERTPPLQELLQKFEGVQFMTTLDVTSAYYLQIPLHRESRKYTAFLSDSTVYQYKRTPYGFRNSQSAFVRALKLALGSETDEFVVFYVDDVLVFSRTFRDHLRHLDIVLSKLARAGFTLNAAKCRFCQIRFLGHRIDRREVILNWQEERVNLFKVP